MKLIDILKVVNPLRIVGGMRTSTKSGLAGVIAGIILEFIPLTVGPEVSAWLVPLIMYVAARFSVTPVKPGII